MKAGQETPAYRGGPAIGRRPGPAGRHLVANVHTRNVTPSSDQPRLTPPKPVIAVAGSSSNQSSAPPKSTPLSTIALRGGWKTLPKTTSGLSPATASYSCAIVQSSESLAATLKRTAAAAASNIKELVIDTKTETSEKEADDDGSSEQAFPTLSAVQARKDFAKRKQRARLEETRREQKVKDITKQHQEKFEASNEISILQEQLICADTPNREKSLSSPEPSFALSPLTPHSEDEISSAPSLRVDKVQATAAENSNDMNRTAGANTTFTCHLNSLTAALSQNIKSGPTITVTSTPIVKPQSTKSLSNPWVSAAAKIEEHHIDVPVQAADESVTVISAAPADCFISNHPNDSKLDFPKLDEAVGLMSRIEEPKGKKNRLKTGSRRLLGGESAASANSAIDTANAHVQDSILWNNSCKTAVTTHHPPSINTPLFSPFEPSHTDGNPIGYFNTAIGNHPLSPPTRSRYHQQQDILSSSSSTTAPANVLSQFASFRPMSYQPISPLRPRPTSKASEWSLSSSTIPPPPPLLPLSHYSTTSSTTARPPIFSGGSSNNGKPFQAVADPLTATDSDNALNFNTNNSIASNNNNIQRDRYKQSSGFSPSNTNIDMTNDWRATTAHSIDTSKKHYLSQGLAAEDSRRSSHSSLVNQKIIETNDQSIQISSPSADALNNHNMITNDNNSNNTLITSLLFEHPTSSSAKETSIPPPPLEEGYKRELPDAHRKNAVVEETECRGVLTSSKYQQQKDFVERATHKSDNIPKEDIDFSNNNNMTSSAYTNNLDTCANSITNLSNNNSLRNSNNNIPPPPPPPPPFPFPSEPSSFSKIANNNTNSLSEQLTHTYVSSTSSSVRRPSPSDSNWRSSSAPKSASVSAIVAMPNNTTALSVVCSNNSKSNTSNSNTSNSSNSNSNNSNSSNSNSNSNNSNTNNSNSWPQPSTTSSNTPVLASSKVVATTNMVLSRVPDELPVLNKKLYSTNNERRRPSCALPAELSAKGARLETLLQIPASTKAIVVSSGDTTTSSIGSSSSTLNKQSAASTHSGATTKRAWKEKSNISEIASRKRSNSDAMLGGHDLKSSMTVDCPLSLEQEIGCNEVFKDYHHSNAISFSLRPCYGSYDVSGRRYCLENNNKDSSGKAWSRNRKEHLSSNNKQKTTTSSLSSCSSLVINQEVAVSSSPLESYSSVCNTSQRPQLHRFEALRLSRSPQLCRTAKEQDYDSTTENTNNGAHPTKRKEECETSLFPEIDATVDSTSCRDVVSLTKNDWEDVNDNINVNNNFYHHGECDDAVSTNQTVSPERNQTEHGYHSNQTVSHEKNQTKHGYHSNHGNDENNIGNINTMCWHYDIDENNKSIAPTDAKHHSNNIISNVYNHCRPSSHGNVIHHNEDSLVNTERDHISTGNNNSYQSGVGTLQEKQLLLLKNANRVPATNDVTKMLGSSAVITPSTSQMMIMKEFSKTVKPSSFESSSVENPEVAPSQQSSMMDNIAANDTEPTVILSHSCPSNSAVTKLDHDYHQKTDIEHNNSEEQQLLTSTCSSFNEKTSTPESSYVKGSDRHLVPHMTEKINPSAATTDLTERDRRLTNPLTPFVAPVTSSSRTSNSAESNSKFVLSSSAVNCDAKVTGGNTTASSWLNNGAQPQDSSSPLLAYRQQLYPTMVPSSAATGSHLPNSSFVFNALFAGGPYAATGFPPPPPPPPVGTKFSHDQTQILPADRGGNLILASEAVSTTSGANSAQPSMQSATPLCSTANHTQADAWLSLQSQMSPSYVSRTSSHGLERPEAPYNRQNLGGLSGLTGATTSASPVKARPLLGLKTPSTTDLSSTGFPCSTPVDSQPNCFPNQIRPETVAYLNRSSSSGGRTEGRGIQHVGKARSGNTIRNTPPPVSINHNTTRTDMMTQDLAALWEISDRHSGRGGIDVLLPPQSACTAMSVDTVRFAGNCGGGGLASDEQTFSPSHISQDELKIQQRQCVKKSNLHAVHHHVEDQRYGISPEGIVCNFLPLDDKKRLSMDPMISNSCTHVIGTPSDGTVTEPHRYYDTRITSQNIVRSDTTEEPGGNLEKNVNSGFLDPQLFARNKLPTENGVLTSADITKSSTNSGHSLTPYKRESIHLVNESKPYAQAISNRTGQLVWVVPGRGTSLDVHQPREKGATSAYPQPLPATTILSIPAPQPPPKHLDHRQQTQFQHQALRHQSHHHQQHMATYRQSQSTAEPVSSAGCLQHLFPASEDTMYKDNHFSQRRQQLLRQQQQHHDSYSMAMSQPLLQAFTSNGFAQPSGGATSPASDALSFCHHEQQHASCPLSDRGDTSSQQQPCVLGNSMYPNDVTAAAAAAAAAWQHSLHFHPQTQLQQSSLTDLYSQRQQHPLATAVTTATSWLPSHEDVRSMHSSAFQVPRPIEVNEIDATTMLGSFDRGKTQQQFFLGPPRQQQHSVELSHAYNANLNPYRFPSQQKSQESIFTTKGPSGMGHAGFVVDAGHNKQEPVGERTPETPSAA